jgi:hypothetical protein
MATLLKKLTLQLGQGPTATQFECQLSRAEVVDEPETETATTFCGTETFATSAYKLNLAGFQDWTDVAGICEIIHDAYATEPVAELDFEVALGEGAGTKYRSGACKPTQDVPFGGEAGSPLTFEQTLDIIGTPAETALA